MSEISNAVLWCICQCKDCLNRKYFGEKYVNEINGSNKDGKKTLYTMKHYFETFFI